MTTRQNKGKGKLVFPPPDTNPDDESSSDDCEDYPVSESSDSEGEGMPADLRNYTSW